MHVTARHKGPLDLKNSMVRNAASTNAARVFVEHKFGSLGGVDKDVLVRANSPPRYKFPIPSLHR